MPKEHLCMLAHKFDPVKHGVAGWFASEKLDGHRAIWIPGTRGLRKDEVPFANLYDGKRHDQLTTGLWSRYGNVIVAPDWFLDDLPLMILDGELWKRRGRGGRQEVASIIRKIDPVDHEWDDILYCCFDSPPPEALLADRQIKLTNFTRRLSGCLEWWNERNTDLVYRAKRGTRFETALFMLRKYLEPREVCIAHRQTQLSFATNIAAAEIDGMIEGISEEEGEGLILREPSSIWEPHRSYNLLKVKPLDDDEGIVIGYTTGKETDKGSKLLGMMGALVLNFHGKRFELSGFTDEERRLDWTPGVCRAEATMGPSDWAAEHPGQEVPSHIQAAAFPRGSVVTFQYRDLTSYGLPNEARYWRKRTDV